MRISIAAGMALDAAANRVVNSLDPRLSELVSHTPERDVVDWLASVRLLNGIPFQYLVPDDQLLQPETIRFFHVDRNWTDAATEGALSAATFGTRDRTFIAANHKTIRDAVDDAERSQWYDKFYSGDAANPSGFLLRSRAVSGWPGIEALGFRGDRQLSIMRMERLAPAVLLVIFEDIADRIEIREPRQGIQFGVESSSDGTWQIRLRKVVNQTMVDAGTPDNPVMIDVPFRRGAAGVIHVEELAKRVLDKDPTAGLGSVLDSAEFAIQMLRYPAVQTFGPVDEDEPDLPLVHTAQSISETQAYLDRFLVEWDGER